MNIVQFVVPIAFSTLLMSTATVQAQQAKDVNVVNTPAVTVNNALGNPVPVQIVNEGPNCSATECGTFPPVVTSAVNPGSPTVGTPVLLSLDVIDQDNEAPCFLGQLHTVNSAFVQMPPLSVSTLAPTVGTTPAFVPDIGGEYIIRSTVTDELSCSSTIDTTITVGAAQ